MTRPHRFLFASAIVAVALVALALVCYFYRASVLARNEGVAVPVLMYHGVVEAPGKDVWAVSRDEFAMQMRQLREAGYTSLLPDELDRARRGLLLLPPKPIVITFDDGFRNNLQLAEPILRENGMRAICYLILGHIADTPAERTSYRDYENLVWSEVREAAKRGTFTFGVHSIAHIARDPGAERQIRDVPRTRPLFRSKAGFDSRAYSYPFGSNPDPLCEAVRKAGYRTSVICEHRLFRFSRTADLLRIPRISVHGGIHAFRADEATWGEDGTLRVVVSNRAGVGLHLVGVLRDRQTGSEWACVEGIARIGSDRKSTPAATWTWTGLPIDAGANPDRFEIELREPNGLFVYGTLRPVTGASYDPAR